MDLLQKLNEKFASLKVNPSELPNKTKNKIDTLRKTIDSKLPTYRDKNGKFTPKIAEKVRDLIDDIIAEAEAFSDERDSTTPPAEPGTPPPPDPGTPPPTEPKKSSWFDLFD